MLDFPALDPLLIGHDLWLGGVLVLAIFTLIFLSYRRPGSTSGTQEPHLTAVQTRRLTQQIPLTTKQAQRPRHSGGRGGPSRINSEAEWTTELVMRILCSIVILMAAIYIIVFDQAADSDRQKWAFGAVGLVFGHWAKG